VRSGKARNVTDVQVRIGAAFNHGGIGAHRAIHQGKRGVILPAGDRPCGMSVGPPAPGQLG
jgi:hypothetical protein